MGPGGGVHTPGGEVVQSPTGEPGTVVYLEPDGFTHRGGHCVLDLVDGTRLELDLEVVDGWVYRLRDFLSVEGLCRIRRGGEPVDGFCLLEMSNNPRAGAHLPEVAVRAALADGLTRTTSYVRTGVQPCPTP